MNITIDTNKFTYNKGIFKISSPNFKGEENRIPANKLEKSPTNDTFEIKIGYVNDLHGQTNNMMRILSGIKGDIILSGGDNDIGDEKNRPVHDATAKFLNLARVKATALGNHEMDTKQGDLKETATKFDGQILAANIEQKPLVSQDDNDIKNYNKSELKEFIKPSIVVNVKGEKIGLIGVTPIDLTERATHPDYHKDCNAKDLDTTIQLVQNEIDELKKQGINKIILLSHLGIEIDKKVIEKTDGIDVVIGGHTHELIEGITEGDNLIYSKSGEPVIITEAGKDGRHFGELNITFDKSGVITKAQNNLADTSLFHRNLVHQQIFNKILGTPEQVGHIEYAPPAPTSLLEENPHANFMCDAMKYEMDADIAIWNNAGTRNYFKKGNIDSSDIKEIAPFADNISVAEVSEKTLVNAFKTAIEKSYATPGNKPGLLAVSGLNYTIDIKNKTLKEMNFIGNDGKQHNINIDSPDENKKYKVVADSFIMTWGKEFGVLAQKDECIEYPFNKAYLTCEYIKHLNKPIKINQIGRIKYDNE